jgi:hypothetical protein
MAAKKKTEDKPVTKTLATGTKVTAPEEVIVKVQRQADRDAENSKSRSK